MKGTIFDIKELSVHDGPGCRITVFLKGCPLRCKWCHNPEGLDSKPQLMIQKNGCVDCKMCYAPCNHPECKPFGRCLHTCPNGCLKVSGKEIEASELAEILLKNADFLNATGGGITISGGEPLMQPDFVLELAEKLSGVHKAIQTSGFATEEVYQKVIGKFDYIMQDIKLVDSELHKKYTGVDNEVILRNIQWLKNSGKEHIFRMPLIPGITDTPENKATAIEIVGENNIEFLDYNPLTGAKYEMLGMKYEL
ncbi:MAG: glycyl-radical enzyme activating protein [Clostridia bacterium]|nr:glycyl-radical enzyme activating protein [Clostridia bacterium]